jgi:hypothetical protein
MCSFEDLHIIITKEEVAYGPLRQPNYKDDVFVLLPPVYFSWYAQQVSQSVDLITVAISACTGVVSFHPNTILHVSPNHPHDTSDDKKTLGR